VLLNHGVKIEELQEIRNITRDFPEMRLRVCGAGMQDCANAVSD